MWPSILIVSCIQLFSDERGPRWLCSLTKPLPLLLMATAILFSSATRTPLALWVSSGLLVFALADSVISLTGDNSRLASAGYLLAHTCYVIGFISMVGSVTWWIPVVIFALGILTFLLLLPNLERLMVPVLIYLVVIATLGSSSAEYWLSSQSTSANLAIMGAFMLLMCDLMWARNRFLASTLITRQAVLVSYYLAHALLAWSVITL
ncbi:lysoplasmalogenase [Vibrio ostreae]|uniref:Lysoplasmalogenase n=1 Tax=Vibrio ostreae TaxID=2841925 RepID=A0A975U9G5_9VIBR|nr:lysoplasmalogenase [Vibrio ostreae]QXO16364.1 lysoplasmalogenase [Vibrio ostreae]